MSPFRAWNARTAARLTGPYTPSAGTPSARWTGATHQARTRGRPDVPVWSAARVWGPTIPSTRSPFRFWKARTAARVLGPKMPSSAMPSVRWSSLTAGP